MKIDDILSQISKQENISNDSLKQYIASFEKYIKSEIRKYDDRSGLEDYKLSKVDYKILNELYINTKSSPYKIHILLLFMYSYYKLDGISFEPSHFPMKLFFTFMKKNKNIDKLILKLITES